MVLDRRVVRVRRGGWLLLAAALMLGLPPLGVGNAAAAPAAKPAGKASLATVTLITGDRVEVHQRDGRQIPQVRPGKGRTGVKFRVSRVGGHLYVLPSDAIELVGRGQLDRRLFDITSLVRYGYTDAKRRDLPLLVQGNSAESVAPLADDAGGTVTRRLTTVDAVAVRQPKRTAAEFWATVKAGSAMRSGVKRIWLDGKRKALLDKSVPQIGAPSAWQAGFTGKGVKVAVLDTGIDATHPDFAGRLGAVRNFTDTPDANDTVGHGTHVASTIAGTGAASGGKYKGVAPDATLLIGKVCGDQFCDESAILAGMQWAAQSGAAVANLSLGGMDTPEVDPLEQAVNELTAQYGTLFVIAAGNDGTDESVGSPGSADAALTVGAVDKSDQLADFSSRGPRVGDAALKPEITAPGVDIVAANAKDGFLGEPGEKYTTLSGTSMATPHVAGAAAILAQQHPDWKAGTLKSALVGSAKTLPEYGAYAQGAGRVDVARAVSHDGYADPAVVSAGLAMWPHHDDQPVTKTVTYHNPTGQPVTYQLKLRTDGPDGMFSLSADQVTVPAGGTATVDVTVDTRVDSPDRYYSAWLTATAGEATITTPVAVNKEPESYNLTLSLTDRSGAATGEYFAVVQSLDGDRFWMPYDADGSATVRVPKGRYHVLAFIDTPGSGEVPHTSLLTRPVFELTGDATLGLDAREGKPISVTLPNPKAELVAGEVGYTHFYGDSSIGAGVITEDFAGVTSAHLGPELPKDEMYSEVIGVWAVPDATGDVQRAAASYHLAYYEYGHLMTGFAKTVSARELTAVKARYHSHGAGKLGVKFWVPLPESVDAGFAIAFGVATPLPYTRTEYLNIGGVQWTPDLLLVTEEDFEAALFADPVTYRAGRTYRETWNNAVSGPGFTAAAGGAIRVEDDILVWAPLRTDGSGHGGDSFTDTGVTTLYRNGTKVGESDFPGGGEFSVPAGEADYRLETTATRAGSLYSTKLSCTWTFRSGHAAEPTALPLMSVSFAPKVDLHNRAKAGERQHVPVTVRRAADAGKVSLKSLTVEVSFDDGKTWKKVRVTRWPPTGGWLAHISHPTGKQYVSLRTKAVDKDGNTVRETIIRAYGLK